MRKYFVTTIFTAAAILIAVIAGNISNSDEKINGEYVTRKTAVSQLRASGVIEYANSITQTAEGSGAVKNAMVRSGSYVEEGDAVLCVYETSNMPDLSSIISGQDSNYDEIINSVKENAEIKIYTAPKSGKITALSCGQGDVYLSGQELFKISDEGSFQVSMNISEKDISEVSVGQKVVIRCPALDHSMTGYIKSIGATATRGTLQSDKPASIKVIADIGSEKDLRIGYSADCKIITDVTDNVLMIPASSSRNTENDKAAVYVLNKKTGKAEQRIIKIGKSYTNGIEVISGIDEGEMIVTNYSDAENLADRS